LGEKFQTNPANGTATLTVPIPLSKSRGEFQPALALSYSSGSGNGPYGLGWTLGLPSISRRTDKGVPRYVPFAHRAENAAAADGAADIFLLAGSEDLVPISADEGPWIAQRATNGYFVRGFRPRIEGTFSRIESWTRIADGDTHWRTISRDNVLTVYGETSESRVADPKDTQRVFEWLICRSYDDRGNTIEYEYAAEGDDGVDVSRPSERFRLRSATRYLKRIRYGNREPVLLDLSSDSARPGHLPRPHIDSQTGWLFEVVFDYGDEPFSHEPEADGFERVRWTDVPPRPRHSRRDPFSMLRAGFEIRTHRLCRRILISHRMPEMLGSARTLVRAVHLDYDEKPNGTRLSCATQSGYRMLDDGSYRRRSLPSLLLHYAASPLDDPTPRKWIVQQLPRESLENLPTGISGQGYQWTDLDGEGISGVLAEESGAWYYKPNRGAGRFGPVQVVHTRPAGEGGRLQLIDLDSDGRLELATLEQGTGGYFDRTDDLGWTPFRPFRTFPLVDFNSPNVRLTDLSGDGLADILITDDQAITWHPSLGDGGFGEAVRVRVPWNEEGGPRVLLGQADQSVFLADMSGDGLTDLVRIRNGEVCYWPSLGYGRFGAKVTMDGSPWFDEDGVFDARRLRLADTDGSGPTDLIYAARDRVKVFLNESGNALSTPRSISEMVVTEGVSLDVVDLLGRGTACLVWSTALPGIAWRPVQYIDLMCGTKPHLLVGWENQLGAETRVTYGSSTEFYVADREAGRPWVTRLPFPVHVVTRLETIDHVSRNRFVTSYRYHHGHYDGVEREFRGFGMVEQEDSERIGALDLATSGELLQRLPPILTKTWFHTGHYDDERRMSRLYLTEYYREPDQTILLPDTHVPASLTPEGMREACRALKGSMLRQEVYALDNAPESARPYSVSESSFAVHLVQSRGRNRYAVFHTHLREHVTLQYERKLFDVDGRMRTDPRVSHQMTLTVDEFGNVLESVRIGYGRRHTDPDAGLTLEDRARQTQILVTYSERAFTDVVSLPDAFRTPLLATAKSWEIGRAVPGCRRPHETSLFTFDEMKRIVAATRGPNGEVPFADWRGASAAERVPYRRLLDCQRTRYRRNDLSDLLPARRLQAMAVPGEQHTLAFPAGLIAQIFGPRAEESSEVLTTSGGYVDLDADGSLWRPSGRVFYSVEEGSGENERKEATANFFVARRFQDAFGAQTRSDFDAYRLRVTSLVDALGNRSSFDLDYRVLEPFRAIDANGNRTELALDTLGLVAGTAVMGKVGEAAGDSLDGFLIDLDKATVGAYFEDPLSRAPSLLGRASSRVIYDVDAFWQRRGPAVAAVLQRETHDADLALDETSKVQNGLTYSDGFGREIQKKVQAEAGPIDAATVMRRWVGTGWTVFNNKGKPVRQYEPFFTATHGFEFNARHGISPTIIYDPIGRVVATLKPNGTYTKTVYQPWRQETWDDNDTTLLHASDDPDIGAMAGVREPRAASWYDQRIDGGLGAKERDAARRAAAHAATPAVAYFDSLSRTFLTIAHNRSHDGSTAAEERLMSRVVLDIEGAAREMRDALGRLVTRYDYDLSGAQIYRDSADAGKRWMLSDVAGRPLLAFDDLGRRMRTVYDVLRRPASLYVREVDRAEILAERTIYGEEIDGARERNLRGRVARLFDAAGVFTNEKFDFKGNLLSSARQLSVVFDENPDWQHPPSLEPDSYHSHSAYDALNRATVVTTPDGSVLRRTFNEAGLLNRIELRHKGSHRPDIVVQNIDYNAKAQRERIQYGNGVLTEYRYDPLTFRLVQVRTTRNSDSACLQDAAYVFDPIGNITSIEDHAEQQVFFRNQRVDASSDYEYDAIYRLVAATGREHAIVGDGLAHGEFDIRPVNSPLSSDDEALRRYLERFKYDAVGNLLELTHTADRCQWRRVLEYADIDRNNRLTGSHNSSPHERFTYDQHGNTRSMPHLHELVWDFKDQLRRTHHQRVGEGIGGRTHYVYDGGGRRVRKVVVSANGRVLLERLYLDQFEVERRRRSGAMVQRELLHVMDGAARVALVESREAERTTRFQLADHLGSVCIEVDAKAAILSREEYYAFGETSFRREPRTAGLSRKRYRFTGQERDTETGLSYHGARYYAPWLARWTSCDPEGFKDGANLFAYCRCNPVNRTDVKGTDSEWCVFCNPFSDDVEFAPWQFTKEEVAPRALGGLKAIGGGVEAVVGGTMVVGGVASSEVGIGVPIAIGGGVIAVHGADTFVAGLRQLWSGKDTDTFSSQGLQALGVSRGKANLIDAGAGVVFTLGGSAVMKAPSVVAATGSAVQPGLVHLTTDSAEALIGAQKTLGTGSSTIYAGPAALADSSGLAITARTGLLPSRATAAILIPDAATGAFRAPAVLGPISAWQRVSGAVFTEGAGTIDLVTGAFTRTGPATNQLFIYGLDTVMTSSRLALPAAQAYTEPTIDISVNSTSSLIDPGARPSFDFGGSSASSSTSSSGQPASAWLRPDEMAAQACFATGAR
jgi:RHS repeat-associated protein